ncbi:MAG: NAD(P)H-hydrate dehydratase [Alphaproteobacteria bacterium]|nr:NAD(P)H-hydrate dehydratase [Alphaproteobacteria bacterium]
MNEQAWRDAALLTTAEMYEADRLAIAAGASGVELMEAAGAYVADAVEARFERGALAVLCGPGNNGGDGFVAARLLRERGWRVRLGLLGERERLSGDAAEAASRWPGDVEPLAPALLEGAAVVVDALFGAGLKGPPRDAAAETLAAIGGRPVVAVDTPSGVSGDSGADLAAQAGARSPQAAVTVTFFRPKPGHYLLPGRRCCGELVVGDIGTPPAVLDAIAPQTARNDPSLWLDAFPTPEPGQHKYSRGHLLAAGGGEMLGAARMAVRAAQRAGAGMVTLAVPHQAAPLYRVSVESAVVRPYRDTRTFADMLTEHNVGGALIGPGLGAGTLTAREKTLAVLRAGLPAVLDADALSLFEDGQQLLFETICGPTLLTPHEGEFRRLFPDLAAEAVPDMAKTERARRAAARAGCVVLLKGYDTVIAAQDGRAVINANAPAWLATAGAGDVLAGFAAGLAVQDMPVFEAACAAAWLHGAVGAAVGPGLVADELPDRLPAVLRDLLPDA